jgi:hypothetical protein
MVMDAVGSAASDLLGLIKPDKAKLVLDKEDPGYEKGSGPDSVEFMFNPTEYTITQPVTINPNPATSTPGGKPTYGGAGPMTVGMTMFLDDYSSAKGDVTPKVTTLLDWTKPTKKSLGDPVAPCAPVLKFVWGGNPQLDSFRGFLSSVNVTYSVFRKDGRPVQAKVVITIQGWQEPPKKTNPTSHASNSRRTHTTIEGDTLQSIAYGEFGKPRYWRAIAELNGIDDPLRVAPGTTLLIPSVADAASGS